MALRASNYMFTKLFIYQLSRQEDHISQKPLQVGGANDLDLGMSIKMWADWNLMSLKLSTQYCMFLLVLPLQLEGKGPMENSKVLEDGKTKRWKEPGFLNLLVENCAKHLQVFSHQYLRIICYSS